MSVTDDLLNNNTTYAATFDKGSLPAPPARGVAVVACMDARLDVYRLLGLSEGDAHVIRNAGGVVTDDVVRSLTISQLLLGYPRGGAGPAHRLRHDDLPRRRHKGPDRGRHRPETLVRAGSLRRPVAERAPVHRPHPGQPLHPIQGLGSRLRLRRRYRTARRGLTPQQRPTQARPSPHRRPPRLALPLRRAVPSGHPGHA